MNQFFIHAIPDTVVSNFWSRSTLIAKNHINSFGLLIRRVLIRVPEGYTTCKVYTLEARETEPGRERHRDSRY